MSPLPEWGMFGAERLDNGWRLLSNCRVGGCVIHITLIRPATGVALIELEPLWTAQALDLFSDLLAAADFPQRFPGHLPVIHRRMRAADVPMLEMLLAYAFVWIAPITLDPREPWEDEVEALLKASTSGALAAVSQPLLQPGDAPLEAMTSPAKPDQTKPGAPAAPATSAEHVRRRAETWTALAAAAVAATAYLFLTPMAADTAVRPEVPLLSETPSIPPGADAVATVAQEVAPMALAPMREPATQEPDAPTASDASSPTEPPSLSAPPMLASVAAAAHDEGPPGSNGGQEASSEPVVAEHAVTAPPPVPAEPRDEQIGTQALPGPIAAPSGPLPEPSTAMNASGETEPTSVPPADTLQSMPEPAAGVASSVLPPPEPIIALHAPLPEDAPVGGEPFWAVPPSVAVVAIPPPPIAPALPAAELPVVAPMDEIPPAIAVPSVTAPPQPFETPRPMAVPVPAQPTAAPRPAPSLTPTEIEAARRRGEALASVGDFSGARRFLERAAQAGSGPAAMAMAESFDPHVLARRGVIGLRPDRASAQLWYRHALALGVVEAAARLNALEAER